MTEAEREALQVFRDMIRDAGIDVAEWNASDEKQLDVFYIMLEFHNAKERFDRECDDIAERVQGMFKGPTIVQALVDAPHLAKEVMEAEIEAAAHHEMMAGLPPRPPGYFEKLFGQ
jgi:hypothetical protein